MKRVAIILARGGSKRLPRKNIRRFFGKPILHYPIAAAKASKLFDDVLVSTDDSEIATVAMLAGCARVIKRPPELADDHATTIQAMSHAVMRLIAEGAALEHVCCLYPCTPFVEAADLRAGFNLLVADAGRYPAKYCFPVVHFDVAPQRMMRLDERDSRVSTVWPRFDETRTQDLEPRWHDAGQWYWGTADAWANADPIFGPDSVGLPTARDRAIDIDTHEDWMIAEALYQMNHREEAHGT